MARALNRLNSARLESGANVVVKGRSIVKYRNRRDCTRLRRILKARAWKIEVLSFDDIEVVTTRNGRQADWETLRDSLPAYDQPPRSVFFPLPHLSSGISNCAAELRSY